MLSLLALVTVVPITWLRAVLALQRLSHTHSSMCAGLQHQATAGHAWMPAWRIQTSSDALSRPKASSKMLAEPRRLRCRSCSCPSLLSRGVENKIDHRRNAHSLIVPLGHMLLQPRGVPRVCGICARTLSAHGGMLWVQATLLL